MNKKLLSMSFCAFVIGVNLITSVGFCAQQIDDSVEIKPQSEKIPQLTLLSKDLSAVWKFHATNDGLLRILRKSGTSTDAECITVTSNGNVGIGTTNPKVRLSLGSSGTERTLLTYENGNIVRGFGNDLAGVGGWESSVFWPDNGNPTIGGITFGKMSSDGTFTFTPRMFIRNDGNVGIGTTTPLSRLHSVASGGFGGENTDGTSLANNVPILAQSDSTVLGFLNKDSRQAFAINIEGNEGTKAARGYPVFFDKFNGNWNPSIYLKNGNVGIGTTSPNGKLDVINGSISSDTQIAAFTAPGSTGGTGYVTVGSGYVGWDYAGRGGIALNAHGAGGSVGGIFVQRVDNSHSNVGIGTMSPGCKLDVVGGWRLLGSNGATLWSEREDSDFDIMGATNSKRRLLSLHANQQGTQGDLLQIYGYYSGGYRPAFRVTNNGQVYCGTEILCGSDARWKKDIAPLESSLSKVIKLEGKNYFWSVEECPDKGFAREKQIGLIAQEVEKVIPELVHTDDEGFKYVSYEKLTVVLVEAVKELKAENEQFKSENHKLSQEISQIREELLALKTQQEAFKAMFATDVTPQSNASRKIE